MVWWWIYTNEEEGDGGSLAAPRRAASVHVALRRVRAASRGTRGNNSAINPRLIALPSTSGRKRKRQMLDKYLGRLEIYIRE